MASFLAKICWKMQRKRENKNYRFIMFLPNRLEKIPKNNKKIQKTENYHYGFIPSPNRLGNAEKERK